MPPASERPRPVREPAPALPHTWRPLGPRLVGAVLGVGLLVMFAAAWFGFDAETRGKFTPFQIGTMVVLGSLGYACLFALVRSRVVAERERLVVVNGFRRREYDWRQVVSVNLPPGAPWVTLDLADGTSVAVMGIQGSDGGRAVRSARQLRAVVSDLHR